MPILIKSSDVEIRSKMLLSKDILCEMVHQSQLYQLYFDEYSDGILSGFDFYEENDTVYLSAGVIKKSGRYYVSEQKISVTDFLNEFDAQTDIADTDMELLFVFCDDISEAEGVITHCLRLAMLECGEASKTDGISIARFNYSKGRLRHWNKTSGSEALNEQCKEQTEHYSIVCQRHSMNNGAYSLSPYILAQIRCELERKSEKSSWDIALLFELMQNRLVSIEVIKTWLRSYGLSCQTPHEIIGGTLEAFRLSPKTIEQPKIEEHKEPETKPGSYCGY